MGSPVKIWEPFEGAQKRFLSCPVWEVLLHGNRGGGKAQPLYCKVWTPRGWKTIKDMKLGSKICNPDGSVSTVIGVFPQGDVLSYKISVEDGSTYCTEDHLWFAKVLDEYSQLFVTLSGFDDAKIYTTKQLIEIIKDFDVLIPVIPNDQQHGFYGYKSQKIISIVPNKVEPCQCIKVDNPNGLYITDDCIVTHNTDVLLMDYLQGVGQGWGIDYKGLILREATTELGDLVTKSKKWIPQIFPTAKFNSQRKIWTFADGETLWFNYARLEDDYQQYHGHAYPFLGWEEITNHALPNIYLKMMSCNRSAVPGMPLKYRATCNPSGPGHCVPYGEVLTPTGWVDIKDVKVDDIVFSVDKKGFMIETKVNQIHKEYYEGDLIEVNKRGFNLECTPNHKLPKLGGVVGNREQKFTLLPFKDLPGQASILRSCEFTGIIPEDDFIIPEYNLKKIRKSRAIQPKKCSWKNLAHLLGWFLSEGGTQELNYAFSISKSIDTYPVKYKEIENLLIDIGFKFTKNKGGFIVYSRDWFQFFYQFGSYETKFIPKEFKNWNPSLLKILFTSMVDGDGDGSWYTVGESGEYYTASKQLSVDFCEISLKLGFIIGTRFVHKEGKRPCYIIRFKRNFLKHSIINTGNHRYSVSTKTKSIDTKYKNHKGFVYCLGIEKTHTFILQQKGSVWISGNSWVKERFIDKGPAEKVFRDEMGQTRTHIQSSLEENKAMMTADPTYQAKLLAMTQDNKMLRDAWVYGSWDLITGGFFTDVWDKRIHILPNFKLPRSWTLFRSFDWGSSKPWCVTYGIETNGEQPDRIAGVNIPFFPRNSVIIIDEIYGWTGIANEGDRATSQEIAERVLDKDRSLYVEYNVQTKPGPADTSIWEVRDGTSIAANLALHGCRWVKAYKGSGSRISGWALIRQMLGAAKRGDLESPHLYFFEQAQHHTRTLPVMQRDKKKPEDIDCFVAGTTVLMENNKTKYIENIKIGDLVQTPIGLRKVIKAGLSGYSITHKIYLSNGEILEATPDHKIFVEGQGLVPICKINKGDVLCSEKCFITKEYNLLAETHSITNAIHQIVNFLMEQHCCTEQYGLILLEKFQKDMKSITSTILKPTIELKILNLFVAQIMQDTTFKKDLKKVGIYTKDLKNGEKLKKVKSNLDVIWKKVEKLLNKENIRALIVLRLLIQQMVHKNTALLIAEKKQNQLLDNVLSVKNYSNDYESLTQKLVVINVVGNCEKKEVFNLTTEQAHLYYANNCLVSNTTMEDHAMDSLRYLLARKLKSLKRKKVGI